MTNLLGKAVVFTVLRPDAAVERVGYICAVEHDPTVGKGRWRFLLESDGTFWNEYADDVELCSEQEAKRVKKNQRARYRRSTRSRK